MKPAHDSEERAHSGESATGHAPNEPSGLNSSGSESAPAIVVLPPLGAAEAEMVPLIDALKSRWPSVYLTVCDRTGDAGFEAHLTQARAALTAAMKARRGSAPLIVIGASYGGMVGRLALCQWLSEQQGSHARLVDSREAASGSPMDETRVDPADGPQMARITQMTQMNRRSVNDRTAGSLAVALVLLDSPHEDSHALIRAYVGAEADVELPNPEGVDLQAVAECLRRECPPGALGSTPLTVLSRAEGTWPGDHWALAVAESLWLTGQRRLALLSNVGRCDVVEGSGHAVWREAPTAVVDAVGRLARDSVRAGRSGNP